MPFIFFSQQGYLGNKNILRFNGFISPTFFSGSFFDKYYFVDKERLVEKFNWIEYGLEVNYLRNYRPHISIGATAEYYNYNIEVKRDYFENRFSNETYNNVDSIQIRCENLEFHQFSFFPTMNLYHKDGNGPIGLFYSIGVGVGYSKLNNKNYGYQLNQTPVNYEDNENWSSLDYYANEQKWPLIIALSARFGFGFNHPITDHVTWNTNINYTVNYNFKPTENQFNSIYNDLFNLEDSYYTIQRKNLFVFSLGTGFSILF